jgi:hypothetical protein
LLHPHIVVALRDSCQCRNTAKNCVYSPELNLCGAGMSFLCNRRVSASPQSCVPFRVKRLTGSAPANGPIVNPWGPSPASPGRRERVARSGRSHAIRTGVAGVRQSSIEIASGFLVRCGSSLGPVRLGCRAGDQPSFWLSSVTTAAYGQVRSKGVQMLSTACLPCVYGESPARLR